MVVTTGFFDVINGERAQSESNHLSVGRPPRINIPFPHHIPLSYNPREGKGITRTSLFSRNKGTQKRIGIPGR